MGGPQAIAPLVGLQAPAICWWRRFGIPAPHRNFLRLTHPEVFEDDPFTPEQQRAIQFRVCLPKPPPRVGKKRGPKRKESTQHAA